MFLIDIYVFLPGKISTQHLLNHLFQNKMNYECNSKFFTCMHTYICEITLFGSSWHTNTTIMGSLEDGYSAPRHMLRLLLGPFFLLLLFFFWFNSIDFNRVTWAEIWLTDFNRSNVHAPKIKVLSLETVQEGLKTTWGSTIFWIPFCLLYILMRSVLCWKRLWFT